MLRDAHLTAIYVTEYQRTQQTAEPSAASSHLRPERISAGNTPALVDAIRRQTSGAVLVVGHSNTVPTIISMLEGPSVRIADSEFDSLFILTITPPGPSFIHLHYGDRSAAPAAGNMRSGAMLNNRSPVMQIKFVRSGGFPGALRRVNGIIDFNDQGADVISDAKYRRTLSSDEADQLRAGSEPSQLTQAAGQIAARTAQARDIDHYQITVTTKDGQTHNVELNTSGASNELQGVSPDVVKLLRWLQDESQKILQHRAASQ